MSLPSTNFDPSNCTNQFREAAIDSTHEILTDIYNANNNIVIWQRDLSNDLILATNNIIDTKPNLQTTMTVSPRDAYNAIVNVLGTTQYAHALSEDIALLVDMFCCLFELKRVGLRLTSLDRAMCPRFHVDRVACRLVTTYQGIATEWLPHATVNRNKLGSGNQGKSDEQSGLFNSAADIQRLRQGDVALLKGELWEGNEGAGLVHRSPQLPNNKPRLLLTLDCIND